MEDRDKQAFGRRFKQARLAAKLTQEALAKQLGLVKQSISHYETARWVPETAMLVRAAQRLNVTTDYLLTGSGAHPLHPVNLIPRLTTAQLLSYAKGTLKLADVDDRRPTLVEGDADQFLSLEINRAMEKPDGAGIPAGSILTIDTRRAPEPGDVIVVALPATDEIVFGRYRLGPTRKADDFAVKADNADWGERPIIKKDRARILGVMREVIQLRSR